MGGAISRIGTAGYISNQIFGQRLVVKIRLVGDAFGALCTAVAGKSVFGDFPHRKIIFRSIIIVLTAGGFSRIAIYPAVIGF